MRKLGAFAVKTHLSQLLHQVEEEKETIQITRHGRVVALLTPVSQTNPIVDAIASIRKNRKGVTLGKKLSLKKLIEEGRR